MEGQRPQWVTFDEMVDYLSRQQMYEHATEIVKLLRLLEGVSECTIMDPSDQEDPSIYIEIGGRKYMMGMTNAQ